MLKKAMIYLVSLSIWLVDFFTKKLVINSLFWGESCPIIKGFNLVLYGNRGGAFNFLSSTVFGPYFLLLVTFLTSVYLLFTLHKKDDWRIKLGKALVLGGALGNLTDRFVYQQVIDFLDFYWKNWHYPAFNFADSAICVGMLLWFWGINLGKKIR